jgi:hypothetical protein
MGLAAGLPRLAQVLALELERLIDLRGDASDRKL